MAEDIIEVSRPENLLEMLGKRRFIDGVLYEFKTASYAPIWPIYFWEKVK